MYSVFDITFICTYLSLASPCRNNSISQANNLLKLQLLATIHDISNRKDVLPFLVITYESVNTRDAGILPPRLGLLLARGYILVHYDPLSVTDSSDLFVCRRYVFIFSQFIIICYSLSPFFFFSSSILLQ